MYPIKAVALKTGLTTHTIRVWERRYDVVKPVRTDTNRRLYSEDEVQKLILLKKATQAGHSIGQLSRLPLIEITQLVKDQHISPISPVSSLINQVEQDEESPVYYVKVALRAAEDFDNETLDDILIQAGVNFSQPVLIEEVIVPFLNTLGDKWFAGDVRIAQEHAASAVVRSFLGRMLSSIRTMEKGPTLLAATVSGLYHEFGAMIVAISAASQGWRAHYLGPNLPAEEIAFSVKRMNAKAVVISIVYPPNDEVVREQLVLLSRVLPSDVALLIGGRSADSYVSTLQSIRAQWTHSMGELHEQLLQLRLIYKESLG